MAHAPSAQPVALSRGDLSLSDTSSQGSTDYLRIEWEHQYLQSNDLLGSCDTDRDAPPAIAFTALRDGEGGPRADRATTHTVAAADEEEESRRREAVALLASIQSSKHLSAGAETMPSAEAGALTSSASGWVDEAVDNENERSRLGCPSCWSEEALGNNTNISNNNNNTGTSNNTNSPSFAQPALLHSWQQQGATEEEDEDIESQIRSRAMSSSHLGSICRTGSGMHNNTPPTVLMRSPTHAREATNPFIDTAGRHVHGGPFAGSRSISPTNQVQSARTTTATTNGSASHAVPSPAMPSSMTSPVSRTLESCALGMLATPGADGGANYQVLSPEMLSLLHAQQQQQQHKQQQEQEQARVRAGVTARRGSLHGAVGSRHNSLTKGPLGGGDICTLTGASSCLSSPTSLPFGLPSPASVTPPHFPHDAVPAVPAPISHSANTTVMSGVDLLATFGSTFSSVDTPTAAPTAVSARMNSFLRSQPSGADDGDASVLNNSHSTTAPHSGSRGGRSHMSVLTSPEVPQQGGLAVPCSAALSSFLGTSMPIGQTYPGTAPRASGTAANGVYSIHPTHHPLNTVTLTSTPSSPFAEGTSPTARFVSSRRTSDPFSNSTGAGTGQLEGSGLGGGLPGFSPHQSLSNYEQSSSQRPSNATATGSTTMVLPQPQPPHANHDPEEALTSGRDRAKRNVYVKGLPPSWNTTRLRELCETVGPVLCAKVARDQVSNCSRCFGFVLYENEASARACIAKFHGLHVPLGEPEEGKELNSSGTPALAAATGTIPAPAMTVLSCRFAHERAAPKFGQTTPPPTTTTTNTAGASCHMAFSQSQQDGQANHPLPLGCVMGDSTDPAGSLNGTTSMPLDTPFGSVVFSENGNASLLHTGPTNALFASGSELLARSGFGLIRSPNAPTSTDPRPFGDTVSSLNLTWPTVPLQPPPPLQGPASLLSHPPAPPPLPHLLSSAPPALTALMPVHTRSPFAPVLTNSSMAAAASTPQWVAVASTNSNSANFFTPLTAAADVPAATASVRSPTTGTHQSHGPAPASPGTSDGRKNVYVTNLPRTWNTTMLRKLCATFGHILSASVAHHRQTNEPLGYGFVLFEAPESAARCIRQLDQKVLVVQPDENQSFVIEGSPVAPLPGVQQCVLTCRYAKDTAAPSWMGSSSTPTQPNI